MFVCIVMDYYKLGESLGNFSIFYNILLYPITFIIMIVHMYSPNISILEVQCTCRK